eukprot:scaffold42512_cov75-Phaeocystis_antarctica.AAC.3
MGPRRMTARSMPLADWDPTAMFSARLTCTTRSPISGSRWPRWRLHAQIWRPSALAARFMQLVVRTTQR